MVVLTTEQIENFHQRLLEAKEIGDALLNQTAEDIGGVPVSGGTIGRLTRMDAIQVQGMAKMNREQLTIRLKQIDAALAAHQAGHYGRCNRCKKGISLNRLEALPEAPLCMPCQEQIEQG